MKDGSRQRTMGGVFFVLAKERLTAEQRRKIFAYRSKKKPVAGKTEATV